MSNLQESNTRISAERLLSHFGHRESLVLFAMVSFGILGCIVCFSSALTQSSYSSHNIGLIDESLVATQKDKPIQIQGEKLVGEELQFQINTQKNKTPLYMDYGDGEIKRIYNSGTLFYNYSFPGEYQLNLFTIDRNHKKVISTEKIKISPNTSQLSILK